MMEIASSTKFTSRPMSTTSLVSSNNENSRTPIHILICDPIRKIHAWHSRKHLIREVCRIRHHLLKEFRRYAVRNHKLTEIEGYGRYGRASRNSNSTTSSNGTGGG